MQTATQNTPGNAPRPTFETATVAEAMHPGVMICAPDEPLIEVARAFAAHRVHAVLVEGVSGAGEGHGERLVWRVLSDRDLCAAALAGVDRTAADVANTEALTIEREAPIVEAARLLTEHAVSHLIVVSDGRPVGVLSTLDIAAAIAWGRPGPSR